jgi:phosphatidylserine/phosphatidylglycerophosphate/cardiolipin synthase-like enzyme
MLLHPKNHYHLLLQAIKYCQNSISIVSPWVSSYVLNSEFFTSLKVAQARNSNIKIMFGYKETNFSLDELEKIVNKDNHSYSNKEETILALKKLRDILKDNLEYKPPLHTKILLIDDQLLFIGSHNWLSNQGRGEREEISTLVTDKQAINYVKKRFGI